MNWNRLQYAGLLLLASFTCACAEDVGTCNGSLQGRDTVVMNNMVVYGGQAIINRGCTTGCHSSKATGADRRGVPAGLDFDLVPVDEEDTAGTKKSGSATIVKLKSAQIAGLRARQKKIVEQRDLIWQQVQDGLMPPGGMFETVMSNIFASSEKTPCTPGKEYSKIPQVQTREVLRNWLACGAPLVETNSSKVDKTVAPGAAGYQYPSCKPENTVTLDSLFKTTFGDCGGCHNSSITGPPMFASLEVLEASLRTKSVCAKKRFVTPGKPEESYLLDLLKGPNPECNHAQMPKDNPFSARAIAEVEAWIVAGAPTTEADLSSEPEDGDPPTDEAEDDQGNESDEPDDEAQVPDEEVEEAKDAGVLKDAGVDAGKDAGSDAGKDAGRDAGKDAGRDAGK